MTDQETFYSPAEIRHSIGASGSFSLNNVSGDVRIRGVDGDEVIVRARWDGGGGDQPLPLVVRRTAGSLSVETDTKLSWFSFRNRSDVEFDISVPKGARVEIQAVSADIKASDLTGDQSYKTVSGDLKIDGSGGRVSATSVSGDVDLNGALPLEANINTTSGDAEAAAPMFQPVRMRTVSGDLSVRGGFAPGPQHTVESVSGDLTIEATTGLTVDTKRGLDFSKKNSPPMVSGDGGASLRFRSLSGDVRLSGFINPATPTAPSAPAAFVDAPPPPPPPPPMSKEDSLEILRALERGEIDIEEASRRLEKELVAVADVDKILRLVSEGVLTPEEADEILSATPEVEPPPAAPATSSKGEARHLRIEVMENGKKVVHLRVPMTVAGWASAFLPGLSDDQADRIRGAMASGERGPLLDINDSDGSRVLIVSE